MASLLAVRCRRFELLIYKQRNNLIPFDCNDQIGNPGPKLPLPTGPNLVD